MSYYRNWDYDIWGIKFSDLFVWVLSAQNASIIQRNKESRAVETSMENSLPKEVA